MAAERGQTRLNIVALSLVLTCAAAAVMVGMTAGPGGSDKAASRPGAGIAVGADDLVIDFTGRTAPDGVAWRVEGKTDRVRRTARGLLIVASSAEDPPRLVLDLGVPEESLALLEVTMALNKGTRGRIWGSRYPGEAPSAERSRYFQLTPGLGARTYRVALGAGEHRGAPLHSLTIQLTDEPVRAVVREVRLRRTAGWQSYVACGSGEESMVVIGGTGLAAVPGPESGSLTMEVDLPLHRPALHLALAVHPLQRILGRSETMFRVRVEPLDNGGEHAIEEEPVVQQTVDPGDPAHRRWFFSEGDLSDWAGRKVRLHLETLTWRREEGNPERLLPGRPAWGLPLWGPVMISGGGTAAPPAGIVLVLFDGVGRDELGCFGEPSGFPAVSRFFGGAALLRDAYLVEYSRDRFLHSLLQADYYGPDGIPETGAGDAGLVTHLRQQGVRTAAFFSGNRAEDLLRDHRLQLGFEVLGRADIELGLGDGALHGHPGPLQWLGQVGDDPFFLLVHFDAGGSKEGDWEERLAVIDRAMGRLGGRLGALGRREQTIVCLAGLRGPVREARVDRGCRLWDESALIPLLVRAPGSLSGPVEQGRIFRSIDILPTLVGLAGMELVPGDRAGLSLAPWLCGTAEKDWPVDEVFLSQRRAGRRYLGLRRGSLKLIWRTEPRAPAACYDLDGDPGERTDIAPGGSLSHPFYEAAALGSDHYTELVRRLESHFGP